MAGGPPVSQEEDLSLRCEALRVQLDSFAMATEAVGAPGTGAVERCQLVGWFMVQLPIKLPCLLVCS